VELARGHGNQKTDPAKARTRTKQKGKETQKAAAYFLDPFKRQIERMKSL
jgi:hypothetical protein